MLLSMIEGFATAEGTRRFADRFPALQAAAHFRQAKHVPEVEELWFPSLGLGTYLGEPDIASDQLYTQAVETAVLSGINLVDSAINYRHQRSERSVGAALAAKIAAGQIGRDEIILCTKAGFLSFDGSVPSDPRGYFFKEYVETGVLDPADLAGGMHCMSPGYLENQLERSRKNLGVATIDIFYIHNPESQLGNISRETLRTRLKSAFSTMEQAVRERKIRWYGIASWNSFRVSETSQSYISLPVCLELARDAGGEDHHFRFIQLPFNLGMPEAFAVPTQGTGEELVSSLEFIRSHSMAPIASASLYQGQLMHGLPPWLAQRIGLASDTERALQFARSAPGVLTALVGMGKPAHVLENIRTALSPPLSADAFQALFSQD